MESLLFHHLMNKNRQEPLENLIRVEFSGAARQLPPYPQRPSIQETHNFCSFLVSEIVELLRADHTLEEIQFLLTKWTTKDLSPAPKITNHEEYVDNNLDARVDIKYYIDDNSAKNGMNTYAAGRVVHEMNLDKRDPTTKKWIIREEDQKILKRPGWENDNAGKTLAEVHRQINEGSFPQDSIPPKCFEPCTGIVKCAKCYYSNLNANVPLTLKHTPHICQKCGNDDCKGKSRLVEGLMDEEPEKCFYYEYKWNHPPYIKCDTDECTICSLRDCPKGEPLHFHHEGCPACCGRK